MSCCLYWVKLEERPSVRVLASAVDDDGQRCTIPGASSPKRLNFLQWRLIYANPKDGINHDVTLLASGILRRLLDC